MYFHTSSGWATRFGLVDCLISRPILPCVPPWAIVGRALVGPPWALVASPGPLWAGPLSPPLGPYELGPNGPSWDICIYIYVYMSIYI